jgi:hypothetical protein
MMCKSKEMGNLGSSCISTKWSSEFQDGQEAVKRVPKNNLKVKNSLGV